MAQTSRGPTLDSPNDWAHYPISPKVGREWAGNRARVEAEVAQLKNAGFLERKEVFRKSNIDCRNSMPKAFSVYRAATFYLEFTKDWRVMTIDQPTFMIAGLWNSAGSDDPEFARIVYTALCLTRNRGDWRKGLGRRLMSIFPADKRLHKALVYEASNGNPTKEDVKLALQFVDEAEKTGEAAYMVARKRANIFTNLYYRDKSLVMLEAALKQTQLLYRIDPDPDERAFEKRSIEFLTRKLRETKP